MENRLIPLTPLDIPLLSFEPVDLRRTGVREATSVALIE